MTKYFFMYHSKQKIIYRQVTEWVTTIMQITIRSFGLYGKFKVSQNIQEALIRGKILDRLSFKVSEAWNSVTNSIPTVKDKSKFQCTLDLPFFLFKNKKLGDDSSKRPSFCLSNPSQNSSYFFHIFVFVHNIQFTVNFVTYSFWGKR